MSDYKKIGVILFLLFLNLSFVSAQVRYDSDFEFLRDGADRFILLVTNGLSPIFNALLGEYTGSYGDFSESEIFLMRILLLILLFAIINTIGKTLPKIGENPSVVFIVAAVVSIIAVRFMSKSDLIFGVLLPYGTLGVAITTVLPFMIFFWFLHATNVGSMGRRLAWIFFGIVMIALWISKSDQLSSVTNWIYIASIGAIAFAFVFDRGIHRYFALHELSVFYRKSGNKAIASLQAEYLNILSLDTPQAKARRADIERDLNRLGGTVP